MQQLRRRRVLVDLAIVLAAGCVGGYTRSYSPEEDDAAIAAITSAWSGGGLTLTLCEDVNTQELDNTCDNDHVVRGNGRGKRHEEDHGGVGCGGCPMGATAFVKGTASGGDLPGTVAVAGKVAVSANDPYVFPYNVALYCTEPGKSCSLQGTLYEDGTLELATSSAYMAPFATLARTGAASCP